MAPPMYVLIDGDGLILYGMPGDPGGDKQRSTARRDLLDWLAARFGAAAWRVTVFFDPERPELSGAVLPGGGTGKSGSAGIVVWCGPRRNVDELLGRLLQCAASPLHLTVVSDDPLLRDAARLKGCLVAGYGDFWNTSWIPFGGGSTALGGPSAGSVEFSGLPPPDGAGIILCPFCHFHNEAGALFCEQCKSDLTGVPEVPAEPVAAEPITAVPLAEEPVAALPVGEPESLPPPPPYGFAPPEPPPVAAVPVMDEVAAEPVAPPPPNTAPAPAPAPAHAGAEDVTFRAPPRPVPVDRVDFTVTAPAVMAPGGSYVLDVWAHLEDQRRAVLERAREAQAGRDVQARSKGGVPLARGTAVAVRLDLPGFVVTDSEDVIHWDGAIANATFPVGVPPDARPGPHPGTLQFYASGLRIARLAFTVEVGPRAGPSALLPASEQRLRRAFASYASEDRDHVLGRIQGMQKVLPSLDVFLDVASLRSGQRWAERLRAEIEARDTLYLFWSLHAKRSQWVDREWRTALEVHGIDGIDPVPLASPREVPPPKELADELHFNDWVLAYMRGSEVTAAAGPRLLVLRGQKRNVEYPVYEGLNFIGRADEKPVDIDLEDQEPPDRVWCSRQHALIRFEDSPLFLEDLNSANGTYLNRARVYPGQKQALKVNDVIQIGNVQLKVIV